VTKDYYCNL